MAEPSALEDALHFARVAVEKDYPITSTHLRTLLAEVEELARVRAAVTALADELGIESSEISDQLDSSHRVDYDCGEMDAKAMIAARLRETLTQP